MPSRVAIALQRLLAPALALCLLATPPHTPAQQQPTTPQQQDESDEVVRVSSQLVQTDVMVFDKSGKFVDGLKPEQFELKVDGKPQPVLFFERIEAGTVDEDAQLAAARGLSRPGSPGSKVGPLPLDRGRSVIFFADDLHMAPASVHSIRRTLLRFVDEEVGQNDEAMVASASGSVGFLQQFTDNKAVLRAAVGRIAPRPTSLTDMERPAMTVSQAVAIDRNDRQVIDYYVEALQREMMRLPRETAEQMVRTRADSMLRQTAQVAVNTLASLESIVRWSSPVPGRKILFFVSDGFVSNTRDGVVRDRLRRVADAAARSGVVIYSLDAQGLRTNQPDSSSEVAFDPSGRLSASQLGETSLMQSPLYELAAETGGRALLNTNTLNRAVTGALKETARYYLLAWRPEGEEGRGNPKYRKVEVSVKERPELKVVVRRGFLSAPPPDPPPSKRDKKKQQQEAASPDGGAKSEIERELRAAIKAPFPRTAIPTSLSLGYVSAPNNSVVLSASVELDAEEVRKVAGAAAAPTKTDIDIAAIVIDEKGNVVKGLQQEWAVAHEAKSKGLAYTYNFALPPGLYQVRIAARIRRDGRTGTAAQWAELPDVTKGGLALSSIFLGERTSADAAPGEKPGVPIENVSLNVARRFARTSWLRFATYIYNAAAPPDVALQVQVFRDDQPVFTAPLTKVRHEGLPDLTRLPYAAELPLSTFPPGRYVLQVTAIDRATKALAVQRTRFDIE
ncbi:MAG TPA: VWA domain-containing protein [Pyrinomonadaceae bacterium]|jgi:VWFA-related protein|nr:VWA domain-containing protein [Pyrinomonadaceae bacterium]